MSLGFTANLIKGSVGPKAALGSRGLSNFALFLFLLVLLLYIVFFLEGGGVVNFKYLGREGTTW